MRLAAIAKPFDSASEPELIRTRSSVIGAAPAWKAGLQVVHVAGQALRLLIQGSQATRLSYNSIYRDRKFQDRLQRRMLRPIPARKSRCVCSNRYRPFPEGGRKQLIN